MYVDLYREKALTAAGGIIYSDTLDIGAYNLKIWRFALFHTHAGTSSTLTIGLQYSPDNGITWVNGMTVLSAGAVGTGIVNVGETSTVVIVPYAMPFMRFSFDAGTADITSFTAVLGLF